MKAIDVHVHPSTEPYFLACTQGGREDYLEAWEGFTHRKMAPRSEAEMVQDFVDLDIKGLLIAWDAEAESGYPRVNNDYVARVVKDHPQAFLGGWAMIDPWKGQMAIQELERSVKELGLMGLKFQQIIQGFPANDKRFYPLYEKCVELRIPVMFHAGFTGFGSGVLGARGYHLEYGKPIPYIDDVAADLPHLTIIAAHPGWPWEEELIAVLLNKPNVCLDLSGYAPKYFPESIKREVAGRLQDRVMFGSDYPIIPLKRWLDEFEAIFKPEVVEKVFYKNAQRILRLKA